MLGPSIIIPTHARPRMLGRAVESARRAGTDVEIVVVDDGSVDETRDVCAALPDIVYIRLDTQRGVGYARSAGIEASSRTYISFLDDDDVRLPGSIDRQVAVLEASPDAALVYGQVFGANQRLQRNGRVYPSICPSGDVFWRLLAHNFIPSISAVVRRSVLARVGGGPRQDCAPSDDWDLWLRITEHHPVAVLPEPVAIYREPTLWSNQGSSRAIDLVPAALRIIERSAFLPRVLADPDAFRRATALMKQRMANRLLWETVEAARFGDAYSLASFGCAVRSVPRALLRDVVTPRMWQHFWCALKGGDVATAAQSASG